VAAPKIKKAVLETYRGDEDVARNMAHKPSPRMGPPTERLPKKDRLLKEYRDAVEALANGYEDLQIRSKHLEIWDAITRYEATLRTRERRRRHNGSDKLKMRLIGELKDALAGYTGGPRMSFPEKLALYFENIGVARSDLEKLWPDFLLAT